MSRARVFLIAALLAAVPIAICLRGGIHERPLRMDNRLYFYIAERAASGVAPHVSCADVKSQLAPLVDALWIGTGRLFGMDDVYAGRLGSLALLVLGVWGSGLSVYALGATPAASALGALAALSFSGLSGHTMVGFNPKILLFTLLVWLPFFVARERFALAGAVATAAMLTWQPALVACLAVAAAALMTARPARELGRTIASGMAVFALYEAYFAWHGALAAQLFQTFVLPLGSVHEDAHWLHGITFVLVGSGQGIDRLGLPAAAFALVLFGSLATLLGAKLPAPGRTPAPAGAVVALLVGGVISCVFTMYEHQAEPDRFLLVAWFAIALGIVMDRALAFVRPRFGPRNVARLEGVMAAVLLIASSRGESRVTSKGSLEEQRNAGRIVAMMAEAYGSTWTYGCPQLLGLAHLTNYHPLDHFWDDLLRYVDEDGFTPVVDGRLPDVIVKCRRLPGANAVLANYLEIPFPGLSMEKVHIFVRASALEPLVD